MESKWKGVFHNTLQARLFWIVFSALFLAVVTMAASTAYSADLVSTQVASAYREVAVMYLDRIESLFSAAESRMYGITAYESELLLLEAGAKDNRTKLVQKRMMDFLSAEAHSYAYLDGFFLYTPANGSYLEGMAVSRPYREKQEFCGALYGYLGRDPGEIELREWFPMELGGRDYFLRLVQVENSYFGAWASAGSLLQTLRVSDGKSIDYMTFATADGKPMTEDEVLCSENFDFSSSEACYFTNGYLVAGAVSPEGSFQMLVLVARGKLLSQLNILYAFGIAFVLLFLLLAPFITAMIYRWVVQPVNDLVGAMERLRQGELQAVFPDRRLCREFQILNRSFTGMSAQIKNLKLSVYEEKLRKQKTQLNYFQLQIHPHFFANSLNMIYNLAQVGDCGLVQELAMDLCDYYRFSIRNTGDFVTLQSELEHLQRYLAIQKVRFGEQLCVRFRVDPGLLQMELPPLSIETFVENAIKYAMTMDYLTQVEVAVEAVPGEDTVRIQVADNGPGFSEDMMEEILSGRQPESQNQQGRQLGVYNVQQRLWLLYGEEASLSLTNRDPHGTLVEILLPKKRKEAGDDKFDDRG